MRISDWSSDVCSSDLIGLFNIFGSYIFGLSGDYLRKKYVLSGIYAARALVIILFLALPLTPASALVFASTMGFLWLGTVPLTTGLVGQIFRVRSLSPLSGLVFMSHQFGNFLGPWLGGLNSDRNGPLLSPPPTSTPLTSPPRP